MKNLYNKHKTHIIYSFKLKSSKIIFLLILTIFNTSFYISFKCIEKNFQPTVKVLAITQANTYTRTIIDKSLGEVPDKYSTFSNICIINRNEQGEITSVTTNANVIKSIKSTLSQTILKNIKKPQSQDLGIPIGNLTKTYIFSGRGPKIPVKILSSSSPDIHIDSKFESAGVNQTKHKITIITHINVLIILPYETITERITYETLLCETIIVGKVPNVYIAK